jgi:multidrug efflux pump subunit AcrA (membrane-fusion protein)
MKTWKLWAAGVGVAVVAGALAPVWAHDPHEAPSSGSFDLDSPRHPSELTAKYIDLRTAEVDFGSVRRVARLTGTVRAMPERQRIVASAVQGSITRLDVRIGQRVTKGEVIGEIRSAELSRMTNEMHKSEIEYEHASSEVAMTRSNIAQLKNQAAAAQTQAKLLEEEVARLEGGGEAVGPNVLSQKRSAAVQQRSQVETLTISLTQAERTMASLEKIKEATGKSIEAMRGAIEIIHAHPAGIDLDEERKGEGESGGVFLLHAPIDGVVTQRDGVLGQGVDPSKPIVTIVDDSEMLVEGELPESMIGDFAAAIGAEVRIRRPGSPVEDAPIAVGSVKGMSPTVDPIKRTSHLLIVAPNPGGANALREGMFVSLAVLRGEGTDGGRTVVVPVGSVVSDGPMQFVFVRDGDAYVKRDIVPGARDDLVVEIKEGLVPGDVVVTHGAYLLTQLRPKGGAGDEHDHEHGHEH